MRPLLRSARALLRARMIAPTRLTVSEWADRYRYLSREASAEPGKWRTDRAPYLREIMDAISDPLIERVVIMKSAQAGGTEVINNAVGYFVDQDPAPMLVVQPNVEPMAHAWSKDRLAPMIRDTPRLSGRFSSPKSRNSDNAILHKVFPGGHLTIAGANAPSGLASRPIRVVMFDEVDRYPSSAGTEGDPIGLGVKRTATFWNRKIVEVSTPTIENLSRIAQSYEQSDQRKYWVPCPSCHAYARLTWADIRWQHGDPATARWACPDCGVLHGEEAKYPMLCAGEWRPDNPGHRTAGFYINALYSPWSRWADQAQEFADAQGNPERMRVFVNTVLGECWREDAERVEASGLAARREQYASSVPAGIGLLTAGVDVQADRLEVLIRGWGLAEESWLVAYDILRGDPARGEVWQDLDRLLTQHYADLKVVAACIDSGYGTEAVYRYVAPRQGRRVYATKGLAGAGKPLVGRAGKTNRAGVRLLPIGVDTAKDLLFARLKIATPGPGYLHFPAALDEEYFAQLAAEQVVVKHHKGRATRTYEKLRPRNEAIDLEVLALAALVTLGRSYMNNLGTFASRRAVVAEAPETAPEMPSETVTIERIRRVMRPGRGRNWTSSF